MAQELYRMLSCQCQVAPCYIRTVGEYLKSTIFGNLGFLSVGFLSVQSCMSGKLEDISKTSSI